MQAPIDRSIQIGQINTRFWAEGDEGPAVILIHGLGGYIESWRPVIHALATQHRVYALDLVGHGLTDKPKDASYEISAMAQFVKDFMDAVGIPQASVVGHSMGGSVATRLTLLHPQAVKTMTLVSSGGLGREVSMALRILSLPLLGELLSRPSRTNSERSLRLSVLDPKFVTDEEIDLNFKMTALPGAQRALLKTLRATITLFGQAKKVFVTNVHGLKTITQPCCILWGQQDELVPVQHVEVAVKNLANVRTRVFEQCGHLPMFEHTDDFSRELLDFLCENPSA